MSLSRNTRPWHVGPVVSPCGNTRRREHGTNPNPRFLVFGPFCSLAENARICSTCTRKMFQTRRCQPVGNFIGQLGLQRPLLGTPVVGFGPVVSPCGNAKRRKHDASPNPRVLDFGYVHSLATTQKKPPSLHPNKSPTPTVPTRRYSRWAFGSAMSPSGNTRPQHFGSVVSLSGPPGLGSMTRVRTHGFSCRDVFAPWLKFTRNCSNHARRKRGS